MADINDKTILHVDKLNISYVNSNNEERIIVKDGSFKVNSGEIVLIIGENGSGKSSIFRSIVGDIEQNLTSSIKLFFKNLFNKKKVKYVHSKEMCFLGEKVDSEQKLDNLKRSIGFSKQEDDIDSFYERKVWNYVLDYASHSKDYSLLSTKELEKEVQEVYDGLYCEKYCDGKLKKMRLKKCSGGEKKIVSILSALSRKKSKLFIFDEPINNLDAFHARKLNNYLVDLKNQKDAPGILIITHCPMFLSVDKVYELKKGTLIEKNKNDYIAKSCFGKCSLTNKEKYEEE